MGLSEDAVKKFSLRSLRSGAAGQALLNLMEQSGGVPQAHHYEAIARALGHTSLTRVTLGSYIGPLGNLLYDNSAVVFGEEEGAVGGKADLEARVARLPQYLPFVVRDVVTDEGREEIVKRSESVVPHLPKLPPGIAMIVDADPAVVAAHGAMVAVDDECRRVGWRERLRSKAGVEELVPQCLVDVGRECGDSEVAIEVLFGKLDEVTKTHTRVRANAVARVQTEIDTSRVAHAEDILLLRSSPDLINCIANVLQKFNSKFRELHGKYVAHPASVGSTHIFIVCKFA